LTRIVGHAAADLQGPRRLQRFVENSQRTVWFLLRQHQWW
jgi:hypothetical protein